MTLKRRTTLVLGAGASNEFNLPLGLNLKDQVRARLANFQAPEHLSGDEPMVIAMNQLGAQRSEVIAAAEKARAGIPMFGSIDDFLLQFEHQPLVAEICRLAIAEVILRAENTSNLRGCLSPLPDERGNANASASGTWIGKLMRRLVFKAPSADDAVANLSFVIFNYDRCVEAYLIAALRDGFGLDQADAAAVAAKVPIRHVYGSMGPLPEYRGSKHPINFGDTSADLTTAAATIRTYGQGPADERFAHEIAEMVHGAEQLVCLGYAFHDQGVGLLFPEGKIAGQMFHATTLGLGARESAVEQLAGQVGWMLAEQSSQLIDRIENLTH